MRSDFQFFKFILSVGRITRDRLQGGEDGDRIKS